MGKVQANLQRIISGQFHAVAITVRTDPRSHTAPTESSLSELTRRC